jgi:glutathione S-transferase
LQHFFALRSRYHNDMTYVLHYAPDNASLIIRLALEQLGVPYDTVLVDRGAQAQSSAAYRALNPNGLIPTLETPQGAIFETGAILLWLADTHGGLGPRVDDPDRADFLKWLFFLSNTVHVAERMIFYPDKYVGTDAAHQAALLLGLQKALHGHFGVLNDMVHQRPSWAANLLPSVFDFYLCALLRWPAIYPADQDRGWFALNNYPALFDLCTQIESLPVCACLQEAEGLGTRPFTDPHPANPSIGSAT